MLRTRVSPAVRVLRVKMTIHAQNDQSSHQSTCTKHSRARTYAVRCVLSEENPALQCIASYDVTQQTWAIRTALDCQVRLESMRTAWPPFG